MNSSNSISEITLNVPVKKYAQHPTRPDLVAGVTGFDMVFIGQKWYSLDDICWIEPHTAHYSHRNIQYPGREIAYSYLVDSVSFSPSGNRLLVVVRSSLVVDGIVKGLFETALESDDVERGDCIICFILFDLDSGDYIIRNRDGKGGYLWPKELAYVRWINDDLLYYCKHPIIMQDFTESGTLPLGFDKPNKQSYQKYLQGLKQKSMDNYVLACRLMQTHYNSCFPLSRAYLGHHVFPAIISGQRYMYYVESEIVYCNQIPSSSLTDGQKIHSVNLPIRDTCKPIPGKKCYISQVTFEGPVAVLHLVNAEYALVRVTLSDQCDKLIVVSDPIS